MRPVAHKNDAAAQQGHAKCCGFVILSVKTSMETRFTFIKVVASCRRLVYVRPNSSLQNIRSHSHPFAFNEKIHFFSKSLKFLFKELPRAVVHKETLSERSGLVLQRQKQCPFSPKTG